jgi:hypothetical protein
MRRKRFKCSGGEPRAFDLPQKNRTFRCIALSDATGDISNRIRRQLRAGTDEFSPALAVDCKVSAHMRHSQPLAPFVLPR